MARSIDTSGIDDIIGYWLRRAQVAVFARFSRAFAEAGITPTEYSVLILISDNPGLRPSQVAAAIGVQRANFVAIAAGLEARGLIERRAAESDRRSHALYLTEAGARWEKTIRAIQEGFEADMVEEIGGTAERDRLLAVLRRLG